MVTFARFFSVAVFSLSLAAHVCTFFPGLPISKRWVWPLHLGAMAAFFMMIFFIVATGRRLANVPTDGGWRERSRATNLAQNEFMKGMLRRIPTRVKVAGAGLVVYAFLNFFVFMGLSEGG